VRRGCNEPAPWKIKPDRKKPAAQSGDVGLFDVAGFRVTQPAADRQETCNWPTRGSLYYCSRRPTSACGRNSAIWRQRRLPGVGLPRC
jgi:hypothetical protein